MNIDVFIQHILGASSLNNIYVAVAIVILTTLLIWIIVRTSRSGDTVLLIGLCDSGKTLLYSYLTARKFMPTQTSIKENKGRYLAEAGKGGKSWNLIDLPGHERLRSKYLYKHKDNARGAVFVIDSVNFPREIRDVAELMYDLLANRTMKRNKAAILVACNKQDQTTAKSCNVIKVQLEKEISNLRKTRSAALLGIDDYSSSKNAFIGKQGKDFEFSHVHPIKVEFCECSLKNESEQTAQIDELETWLNKL